MVNPEMTFSPALRPRSSISVRRPASAHFLAATGPPNPAPTTMTSYSFRKSAGAMIQAPLPVPGISHFQPPTPPLYPPEADFRGASPPRLESDRCETSFRESHLATSRLR